MGKRDKLIRRLLEKPKDFTWDELAILLKGFGYTQDKSGKTGGSRRRFVHDDEKITPIFLHKPHPDNHLHGYQMAIVMSL